MEKKQANRPLLVIGSIFVGIVIVYLFLQSSAGDNGQLTNEQQLAQLLSEIDLVGQVHVYFHYEQSQDAQSFLSVAQKEQLTGVIIVAEGAHNAKVRILLKETVGNVLQIPAHRIQIVPMQMKEEEK